jgi:hypothetical protein
MAKVKKPTVKKAQSGTSVSQDKKGNYYYTKKVNTKDGPRYYQGISPDYNMAEMEANFKAKRMPADSTRKATIRPFELKKMDEKKKGGVIKKAQNGKVVTQDDRGVYTYTKKVNTKNGPRYYQGKSLNRSMAENIADFKNRATPADSTRKADISALKLKTMDEEYKKGGVIKKMQTGGKIEEQYQKQKNVTSKQAQIDKIKTPYPKTTLKKANSGIKVKKTTKPVAKKIVKLIKKKK